MNTHNLLNKLASMNKKKQAHDGKEHKNADEDLSEKMLAGLLYIQWKNKNPTLTTPSSHPLEKTRDFFLPVFLISITCALLVGVTYAGLSKNAEYDLTEGTSKSTYQKTINFNGVIKDPLGNIIDEKLDIAFNIYDNETEGNLLYTGTCYGEQGITPDAQGYISVAIGEDCGMKPVPEDIFTRNTKSFLGIAIGNDNEMKPRQPITQTGLSQESNSLSGLTLGSHENSIPYIDTNGNIKIGTQRPTLRSTMKGSSFTIESAGDMNLQTSDIGNIVLNATESGNILFRSGGYSRTLPDMFTRMIITTQGNVGIGTTKPSAQLDIMGDASLSGNISFRNPERSNINILNDAGLHINSSPGNDHLLENVLTVNRNGLGIGTLNPQTPLEVNTNLESKYIASFRNKNEKGLSLGLEVAMGKKGASGDRYITFTDSGGSQVGSIVSNETGGVSYETPGNDLAEYFKKEYSEEKFSIGDVICFGKTGGVTKCDREHSAVIGVVSNRAGFIGGADKKNNKDYILVGILGQLYVKVNDESSNLPAGSAIASTNLKGIAGEPQENKIILGRTLEKPIRISTDNYIVYAYITPNSRENVLSIEKTLQKRYKELNENLADIQKEQENISKALHIGKVISEKIGEVDMLIRSVIVEEKIYSPHVESDILVANDSLHTSHITSIDNDITIQLNENKTRESSTPASLVIKGVKDQAVASIDNEGNATFKATIKANKVKSERIEAKTVLIKENATIEGSLRAQEASISGTIFAKNIVSDNVESLERKVGKIEQSIRDETKPTRNIMEEVYIIKEELARMKDVRIPKVQDHALHELIDISLDGTTHMAKANITHSLYVGTLKIEENTILGLTPQLNIASLETITFFGNVLTINRDGTIHTTGTIHTEGGIETDTIAPLQKGNNIALQLDKMNRLEINDGNERQVAHIDASGSAKFESVAVNRLTINAKNLEYVPIAADENLQKNGIYAPAIETTTEVAGKGYIMPDTKEVIIYNENITTQSLVYLTPTGATPTGQLSILEKEDCKDRLGCRPYFRVATNNQTEEALQFNWLIINTQ